MAVRDWSSGVAWTVVIVSFVLMNVLRALIRGALLPEQVRLTGLLGLILWVTWLAFMIWMVLQRGGKSTRRRRAA
jgi:cytosine/uracil/thiamine/allantoin permease